MANPASTPWEYSSIPPRNTRVSSEEYCSILKGYWRVQASFLSGKARLVLPVLLLIVGIEGPFFGDARLLERFTYQLLFGGREGQLATAAHEVTIAPEVGDAPGAEGAILIGEHLLLEIGEASGEADGFVVAIEGAGGVLRALCWVDNTDDFVRLQ